MQIKRNFYILLALISCAGYAMAANQQSLLEKREQIIKQYLLDLQEADYKDIGNLFEKDGVVISTSKGKANAKEFFYVFLPNVLKANSELHQLYVNNSGNDRMAVRFHLNFKLKDGEIRKGEYMDEFVFTENSEKLSAVYMFENLKFDSK